MPRAVQTQHGLLVHLFDHGSKTVCGVFPTRNAPATVERKLMCSMCYGKDRGLSTYNAASLGVTRIVEQ